jgi:tetratricopeptide (TPR) repeat protein
VQESPRVLAERAVNLTNDQRGQLMMARKLYRDAIDFFKAEADKDAVMANKTGIAYHLLGDLKNAKKYYERSIKLDRSYAEAYNNLGTVHYAKKDFGDAIKSYQTAIALKPESASVWSNLGSAQLGRKKYPEAIAAYQHALELDPEVFDRRGSNGVLLQERSVDEQALFHFTLARTYAQTGDVDKMLRSMRFALEFGFKNRKRFLEDPEFAAFQDNAEFKLLLNTEYNVL